MFLEPDEEIDVAAENKEIISREEVSVSYYILWPNGAADAKAACSSCCEQFRTYRAIQYKLSEFSLGSLL